MSTKEECEQALRILEGPPTDTWAQHIATIRARLEELSVQLGLAQADAANAEFDLGTIKYELRERTKENADLRAKVEELERTIENLEHEIQHGRRHD